MTLRIAINGFGRIGRLILRGILETNQSDVHVVAINDLGKPEDHAHLFKYDSVHGRYSGHVTYSDDTLCIDQQRIKLFQHSNPADLPWADLDIDIVFECSGHFTKRSQSALHLEAGAKRVLISAPSVDADFTVVYGVNHGELTSSHKIVSNASCTTNCLAPLADVLHKAVGIDCGYMTTIHSYTGDQRLVDMQHNDLRRARAAAESIVPSSTGAAKAVGLVLPELKGKLDGTALRVPTSNVSVVDFKFVSQTPGVTKDHIHDAVYAASNGRLKGILDVCEAPLVSRDFVHYPASCVFDATQTQIIDGKLCRVLAWYDNEWAFSLRMIDVAKAWRDAA
ncbi:MAG: type I glyceraldehyde-3-phosphate dehydrogenase [Alphaproteobacteria bacterium]|nr:type I glyceraldehyde-3-phosphate dehydrogenase [Alphaproteobacteria bacterium]